MDRIKVGWQVRMCVCTAFAHRDGACLVRIEKARLGFGDLCTSGRT